MRKGAASCFGLSVRGVREQRRAVPNERRPEESVAMSCTGAGDPIGKAV